MNSRERTLAAIRRQETDRVPIDAICIENTAAVGAHLGISPAAVLDALGIDGRTVAANRYRGDLPVREGRTLSPWGTEPGTDYGSTAHHPLAGADTVGAIARHAWPDPARYDFDELRAEIGRWSPDLALRGPYWVSGPLFCTACDLMGMEETLVRMLEEPALVDACLDRVEAFSAGYVERFLAAAGPRLDILYLADDFASQRGLLMDPALWRRFLKPRYARLFALGKRHGLPVWFHSCGDITAVLPDLIQIGLDVWETVQLHTLPFDAVELKRRFGRDVAFFGGISTQRLPFATPAEVADEVRRRIDTLGAGGGYLCGPDHHIKPDVPPANVVALFETARHHRSGA